jgi:hypothetical protein
MGMQGQPTPPPGHVCLETAFGANWRTAENMARALGIPVEPHPTGSEAWVYVPADAVPRIRGQLARGRDAHLEAHTISADHVSCRLVDRHLRFGSAHFARSLALEVKRPTSEPEEFVRIGDLPAIAGAARATRPQGIGWRAALADVDRLIGFIDHHRAAGVPARELASRGVPVI